MRSSYKKTIGIVVPCSDINIEAAYHRYTPPGIAVATNRISFNRISMKTLEDMLQQTERAAKDICHAEPDIIISSSLTIGCFRDAALQNCVEQRTGIPCLTSLTALLHLLERFQFRRVALLTPYQEDVSLLFRTTLLRQGVDICYFKQLMAEDGHPCQSIWDIEALDWRTVWEQIDPDALRRSQADVLLFGASGLQGLERVPQMEQVLGLPVLMAEQFTLLYALEFLGLYSAIPELGWIFQQEHPPLQQELR